MLILLLMSACATSPCFAESTSTPGTDTELYAFVKKFHGNECTGAVIGVRLGLAAKAALKLQAGEKAKARFFKHSCAVDGIQVAAGTTYGNRDLAVEDRHENRLVLTAAKSGRKVEASLTKAAEGKAGQSLAMKKKLQSLPKDSPERHRLETELAAITAWFRTAPDDAVVEVHEIR